MSNATERAIRAAEREWRYHLNMCNAGQGTCFVPWCSCDCHVAARAKVREQEATDRARRP